MDGEHGLGQQRVHAVVGRVLGHGQLFEDHFAFGVDFMGAQRRLGEDVTQQFEAERQLVSG